MASEQLLDGSSASGISGGSARSTVELNIKTLDSRTFTFPVDKNIGVLAFKEKIASHSGVPVGQQRLIFRGKVLKDDHLLSEYNVENGDTLHLVERQAPSSTRVGAGDEVSSNASRGQDYAANGSRGRIGQIAHSVVLGSLNVGDSGEGMTPDMSRVIGAVLNSIGIGNAGGDFQPGVQASHGHEAEGSRANIGSQNQSGNQSFPWQSFNGQSNPVQVPLGAVIAVPTHNVPIPNSVNTLIEYMNTMEQTLSQNDLGDQHINPRSATNDTPAVELPANSHGVPTVEALNALLRRAQHLLGDHTVSALSHIAGHLELEGTYVNPTVRAQVHSLTMRFGVAMQQLGALLLELGRTMLTLRMGQSPAESFVHAGPAVYITPSGPSPIMVQPFPLQTSSLFGGSPAVLPNPISMGPVGVGNGPRNVNIHIHTGANLAPTIATDIREGRPGDRPSGTESGFSGPARVVSGISVTAAALPIHSMLSVAGTNQPVMGPTRASQPFNPSAAEINAEIRRQVANLQNEILAASAGLTAQGQSIGSSTRNEDGNSPQLIPGNSCVGETSQTSLLAMEDQKCQTKPESHSPHTNKKMGTGLESNNQPFASADKCLNNLNGASGHAEDLEGPSRSYSVDINPDGSSVPLGLGLGGLIQKKRERQRGPTKSSDSATAANQNQHSREVGKQVLQSLASRSTKRTGAVSPLEQSTDIATESSERARESADGPVDVANAVSQVLQSPALDGLLAGVSQQTGIGSPDMMRNMLQHFTQNPALRNTMNQIAQQIDNNDLGSMLSGMGRGQGGGIDLAGMMQQMMPIVSQALGNVSTPHPNHNTYPHPSVTPSTHPQNPPPVNLLPLLQRLETPTPSEEIFRSIADSAAGISGNTATCDDIIVNAICNQEGLSEEFMEMLRRDISRKHDDDLGS